MLGCCTMLDETATHPHDSRVNTFMSRAVDVRYDQLEKDFLYGVAGGISKLWCLLSLMVDVRPEAKCDDRLPFCSNGVGESKSPAQLYLTRFVYFAQVLMTLIAASAIKFR